MKRLIWFSVGIYASAAIFAVGFVSATMLMAKPASDVLANADISDIWTSTPRVVDVAQQSFERIPAPVMTQAQPSRSIELDMPGPTLVSAQPSAADTLNVALDQEQTGAIEPVEHADNTDFRAVSADHIAWCKQRYRSYRFEDNSYRSYSGSRRDCVSPFLENAMMNSPSETDTFQDGAILVSVSHDMGEGMGAGMSETYASNDRFLRCSQRYASYRASDNTYRSYSGQRRPCLLD